MFPQNKPRNSTPLLAMDSSPYRSPYRSSHQEKPLPLPHPPLPGNIPSTTRENTPTKLPSPALGNQPPKVEEMALSPVAYVNRSNREETAAVTKVEIPGSVSGSRSTGGLDRDEKVVSSILRRSRKPAMVRKAALAFRICGMVFCLVSFAVMAADKTQGWAGDSFDRYKEYRYCISMTVIGFVYSGFQAYVLVHHFITGQHLIRRPIGYCFDFTMDQILAYLLMSASSSAATRTDGWVSNWGEDEFTKMASASIGMSFLAFFAFAFSSLLSGYNLFSGSS